MDAFRSGTKNAVELANTTSPDDDGKSSWSLRTLANAPMVLSTALSTARTNSDAAVKFLQAMASYTACTGH